MAVGAAGAAAGVVAGAGLSWGTAYGSSLLCGPAAGICAGAVTVALVGYGGYKLYNGGWTQLKGSFGRVFSSETASVGDALTVGTTLGGIAYGAGASFGRGAAVQQEILENATSAGLAHREVIGEVLAGGTRAPSAAPGAALARAEGCPGCPCFVPGTLVLMANGSSKAIEDIEVDDWVVALNPEGSAEAGSYRVTRSIENFTERVIRIEVGASDNPQLIEATSEHPFWTLEGGWVAADSLRAGDRLLDPEMGPVEVLSVAGESRQSPTYNLTVERVHTFFVVSGDRAVLVHNQTLDLGDGYTGRVDSFNTRGGSSFEIHVFDSTGKEVGVHGQTEWIPKHGHKAAPELPQTTQNRLKGALIQENRARGYLPPKGQADITGDKWKDIVKQACP